MPTNVESLQIQISASAKSAGKAIDQLVDKLDQLSSALNSVGGKGIKNISSLGTDSQKAGKNVNNLANHINKYGNAAEKANKKTKSLASAFGTLYANFFWVQRLASGLYKSIISTADYVEAFNYFSVAFGKVASKWDEDWENYGDENARNYTNKFVSTLSDTFKKLSGVSYDPQAGLLSETGLKNLGMNLQQVTQTAAKLGSMMDAVGQTGDTTLATTSAFVKLAGDLSSLYNIDYEQAASKIQSVLQGQSRAGYGFGWDTTMAALQATADSLDLSKAVSEMTQMEKQQLRILTILNQSRVAWGDQANTINTLANQFRLFKNNLGEVANTLGQLFIPVLAKIMPIANGVTIAIKRLMSSIAGFFGIKIEDVGQGYSEIEDSVDGYTDSLEDATEAAKKLKNATLGIDELNINAPHENNGAGAGVGGGIDLTDQILKATEEYEKVWKEAFDRMENEAQKWADRISVALKPIKKLFEDISVGDWFAVGKDVSNIVSGIFNFFADAIARVDWRAVGENIGMFLAGLDWTEILKSIGRLIWEAINAAIELWDEAFNAAPIETAILTAVLGLKFTGIGTAIANNLKKAILASFTGKATIGSAMAGISGWLTSAASVMNYTAFVVLADKILIAIGDGIRSMIPEWASNLIDNMVAGLVVGAAGGAWLGPLGAIAGAITGAIAGAFNREKGGFAASMKQVLVDLFNFDYTLSIFEKVKENFEKGGIYIVLGILQGILGAAAFIAEPIGDFFDLLWDEICRVFGISSPAKEMKPIGNYIFLGIVEGFKDLFGTFDKTISDFWKKNVNPWLSKEKWVESMTGIKDAFEITWNNAISSIKEIWNRFATWLNDRLTWTIDPIVVMGKTIFGGATINLGRIPTFQTGGFPEDGLFMANHNELVGTFSNGKTAVANNEQIVAGIEGGVERAVSKVLAPYLADIAASTRETASKDFFVNIGDREIARANQRGQRALGYALIT